MNRTRLLAIACMLMVLAGCGGEKLYPVSGTVTVDGEPMEGLQVIFAPEGGGGLTGTGTTDAAGKYTIVTMKGKGLPPGEYRVSISKVEAMQTQQEDVSEIPSSSADYEAQAMGGVDQYRQAEKEQKQAIPPKYNKETILKATVAEEENVIDFNLSTKN